MPLVVVDSANIKVHIICLRGTNLLRKVLKL